MYKVNYDFTERELLLILTSEISNLEYSLNDGDIDVHQFNSEVIELRDWIVKKIEAINSKQRLTDED